MFFNKIKNPEEISGIIIPKRFPSGNITKFILELTNFSLNMLKKIPKQHFFDFTLDSLILSIHW